MTKQKKAYSAEGKSCIVCFRDLNANNTRKADIAQANYICIYCRKARDKQRYVNKKEIIREQQREYDLAVKNKVIEAYGGKCACCQETILEFLTISYVNDKDKKSGGKLYRWLIANDFPKENYQLLCFNCNNAKGFLGYCPHNKPE